MSAILGRLQPVCSTEPWRAKFATPFAADFDGRRWACATSGWALAAVPFDGELRPGEVDISAVVPRTRPTHRASLAELRAWVGDVQPRETTCPECRGEAEVCEECDGEGVVEADCRCPDCSGEHDGPECNGASSTCKTCAGDKVVRTPPRPGSVLGGVLNLDLLAAALLSAPPDGEVLIGAGDELSPIQFRAEGWLAVVMPLRETEPQSTFTALAPIAPEAQP